MTLRGIKRAGVPPHGVKRTRVGPHGIKSAGGRSQPAKGPDEASEPLPTEAPLLAVLETRDHRLIDAAASPQVSLGPSVPGSRTAEELTEGLVAGAHHVLIERLEGSLGHACEGSAVTLSTGRPGTQPRLDDPDRHHQQTLARASFGGARRSVLASG
jgi:hypothetical protein